LRIVVITAGITWAVVWLSKEQRWGNLVDIFQQMNLWIFAATLGIFTFGHIIIGLRWWLILRTQDIHIRPWMAIRLYFLGWFYNNFMPSSVGGDLIRAWYITRHTEKRFEAVLSVFVDRAIGLLSTLVIAAFFYFLFLSGRGLKLQANQKPGFVSVIMNNKQVVITGLIAIFAILVLLLLFGKGRDFLRKIWVFSRTAGQKAFKKLKQAVIIYCKKPMTILNVFVLTVVMQLITITGFWLLGSNMGIEADLKYYYVFFTLTWVFGAIPISIGGAVVIESLLAYLFVNFAGVESELALALALSQRIVWMITSLPGAIIHLLGAHLPKEFSIDSEQMIN
jgi:uncharacterized protein (TIRG00374 family)